MSYSDVVRDTRRERIPSDHDLAIALLIDNLSDSFADTTEVEARAEEPPPAVDEVEVRTDNDVADQDPTSSAPNPAKAHAVLMEVRAEQAKLRSKIDPRQVPHD